MKILNNWLDPILSDLLKEKFVYETPHYYGEVSSKQQTECVPFYATRLEYNWIIEYLHRKLQLEVLDKSANLTESYINVQYPGMEGTFHIDHSPLTALYMVTEDVVQGSDFEYYDVDGELKHVPFRQNTLIVFDENYRHRGTAPLEPKPRITLAFKMEYANGI